MVKEAKQSKKSLKDNKSAASAPYIAANTTSVEVSAGKPIKKSSKDTASVTSAPVEPSPSASSKQTKKSKKEEKIVSSFPTGSVSSKLTKTHSKEEMSASASSKQSKKSTKEEKLASASGVGAPSASASSFAEVSNGKQSTKTSKATDNLPVHVMPLASASSTSESSAGYNLGDLSKLLNPQLPVNDIRPIEMVSRATKKVEKRQAKKKVETEKEASKMTHDSELAEPAEVTKDDNDEIRAVLIDQDQPDSTESDIDETEEEKKKVPPTPFLHICLPYCISWRIVSILSDRFSYLSLSFRVGLIYLLIISIIDLYALFFVAAPRQETQTRTRSQTPSDNFCR
jgi:hypothetical protein